jgi:cytosine/adenosine deaminase-related metal-dependent hydrolase
LLPEVWHATPLRVLSLLELTGVRSGREPAALLAEAAARIDSLSAEPNWAGLSPHAPYSTRPELLRRSAAMARERGWRVATHVAESEVEFEMFRDGRGEMYEWLQRNGREMTDCGLGSPVAHLARNDLLGPNLLAIHANYLAPGDAGLLAASGTTVVHCPRSHAFFAHRPFPRRELDAAGVPICLGTDSLATVRPVRSQPLELDLLAEMRALRAADGGLSCDRIVRMATVEGAQAVGLEGRAGELGEGSWADLIAVPFHGGLDEAWEAVVHHPGEVAASMIRGEWVVPPVRL